LPTDATLISSVGTFSIILKTAGNQSLTATDSTTASLNGAGSVSVSPAATSQFTLSAPTTAMTGTPFLLTVAALDAYGNPTSDYNGTVHFTSSDASAVLPANTKLGQGTGLFPVTLNSSGSQTLTATDQAKSAITGTSKAILTTGLTVTSFTPTPTGFTATFS